MHNILDLMLSDPYAGCWITSQNVNFFTVQTEQK